MNGSSNDDQITLTLSGRHSNVIGTLAQWRRVNTAVEVKKRPPLKVRHTNKQKWCTESIELSLKAKFTTTPRRSTDVPSLVHTWATICVISSGQSWKHQSLLTPRGQVNKERKSDIIPLDKVVRIAKPTALFHTAARWERILVCIGSMEGQIQTRSGKQERCSNNQCLIYLVHFSCTHIHSNRFGCANSGQSRVDKNTTTPQSEIGSDYSDAHSRQLGTGRDAKQNTDTMVARCVKRTVHALQDRAR